MMSSKRLMSVNVKPSYHTSLKANILYKEPTLLSLLKSRNWLKYQTERTTRERRWSWFCEKKVSHLFSFLSRTKQNVFLWCLIMTLLKEYFKLKDFLQRVKLSSLRRFLNVNSSILMVDINLRSTIFLMSNFMFKFGYLQLSPNSNSNMVMKSWKI